MLITENVSFGIIWDFVWSGVIDLSSHFHGDVNCWKAMRGGALYIALSSV